MNSKSIYRCNWCDQLFCGECANANDFCSPECEKGQREQAEQEFSEECRKYVSKKSDIKKKLKRS